MHEVLTQLSRRWQSRAATAAHSSLWAMAFFVNAGRTASGSEPMSSYGGKSHTRSPLALGHREPSFVTRMMFT